MATVDRILDVAELRMRRSGYHAVSFRDLATEIGIKSASVHYHFPQKADLGRALVARYAERFLQSLDAALAVEPGAGHPGGAHLDPGHPEPTYNLRAARLNPRRAGVLRRVYFAALIAGEAPCLCGVLGGEAGGLPPELVAQITAFFERQAHWLNHSHSGAAPRADLNQARAWVALLQGAMLLASASREPQQFRAIVDSVADSFTATAAPSDTHRPSA